MRPGVFNIPGTVLGAFLLAVISNGLTMIGASYFVKDFIQGAVLLISVGFIAIISKRTSLKSLNIEPYSIYVYA